MADKKKGAPLPASSAGLLRFFEDETRGFKVSPKIIVTIPSRLIVVSWLMENVSSAVSNYDRIL